MSSTLFGWSAGSETMTYRPQPQAFWRLHVVDSKTGDAHVQQRWAIIDSHGAVKYSEWETILIYPGNPPVKEDICATEETLHAFGRR